MSRIPLHGLARRPGTRAIVTALAIAAACWTMHCGTSSDSGGGAGTGADVTGATGTTGTAGNATGSSTGTSGANAGANSGTTAGTTSGATTGASGTTAGANSGATTGASGATAGTASGATTGTASGASGSSSSDAGVSGKDSGGAPHPDASTSADASPADSGATSDAYAPCPKDGGPCQILPLGDSITFGIEAPMSSVGGGYRVELFKDAVTDHKSITFLGDPTLANGPATVAGQPFPRDNQGHSGWTIDQIATLIPSPALQPIPDIVLLMAGTNDVDGVGTQPVAQAPDRLGTLIDKIVAAAPNTLLVVAQITPLTYSQTQLMTYNAAIPAVVQARASAGKHVMLVDMYTGFNPSTMLGTDGTHPNDSGYVFMGDNWYAAIRSFLY